MRRKRRRWIGVDGEGLGRAPHRYYLLACSDGDAIERRKGLRTIACLNFLLKLGTRDVNVAGYFLSYDWTMILRDLPNDSIHSLLRPELRARPKDEGGGFTRIKWKGFRLHYLAGAMWIRKDDRRVTVWDLGKYSQGPFVDALKEWDLAADVRDQIARMKKRRSAFSWRDRKQIKAYCLSECRALAELAEKIRDAHDDAGIKPRAWHGPGSTAGALLKRERINEKLGPPLPPEVRRAAQIAYVGGRAEISCNGRIDRPVYELDIASAYPDQASRLPCLEHGRWGKTRSVRAMRAATTAIVCGDIDRVRSDWGPLPVRLESGAIVYPCAGARGYWYRDEWDLSVRAFKGLRFDHAYVYYTDCDCRPFGFIPELFAHRLAIGKKTGAGRVIKLALNSVYGKLAQRVGPAQYASWVWAGLITSGTRARLLEHLVAHDRFDSVLMMATDGIYTTEKIAVDLTPRLGGWERVEHPGGLTLVRPGIYWTPDGVLRARGLGRDNAQAALEVFGSALASGEQRVQLPDRTVFGGARLMIRRSPAGVYTRSERYGQWHPIPTRVSLAPGPKRAHDWSPPRLDGVFSAPYAPKGAPKFAILDEIADNTL